MSVKTIPDVIYPESDGEPLGETDLHIHWILRLRDLLQRWYRGKQVYVATDLLLYYEEGVPRHYLVPDVFIVNGVDPHFRRTYKIWEEGRGPDFVLEVTSSSTRVEDEVKKPKKYAAMGVGDYFLYDPTADYLRPPLQGYRLEADGYVPLEPDANGRLYSAEMQLHLCLEAGDLAIFDAETGQRLLTDGEAEHEAAVAAKHDAETAQRNLEAAMSDAEAVKRNAEAVKRNAEAVKRESEAAKREAQAAKQENERLRELLRRHGLEE